MMVWNEGLRCYVLVLNGSLDMLIFIRGIHIHGTVDVSPIPWDLPCQELFSLQVPLECHFIAGNSI